ncbi:hypothetical protein FRB94_001568 [Tulasnella sp. JGI-2019a]|nr:hypothetical protein FRB93_012661 [Tulasnella sp. JGI-2019a]KAG8987702.1 hypothetical protein FRB94_001568 [Tulasnella sp. JGI-2019a]KAG9023853.1 hypothetical protein FRB95_012395 [Tulasnella sp. JGI-2019a]
MASQTQHPSTFVPLFFLPTSQQVAIQLWMLHTPSLPAIDPPPPYVANAALKLAELIELSEAGLLEDMEDESGEVGAAPTLCTAEKEIIATTMSQTSSEMKVLSLPHAWFTALISNKQH